jgi:hypothetical protein
VHVAASPTASPSPLPVPPAPPQQQQRGRRNAGPGRDSSATSASLIDYAPTSVGDGSVRFGSGPCGVRPRIVGPDSIADRWKRRIIGAETDVESDFIGAIANSVT